MRDKRIHVLMDEAELKALDAWRFANKIGSRGEAVRRLVFAGVIATAPGVVSRLSINDLIGMTTQGQGQS